MIFKLKVEADFSHQKWFIESTCKNVRCTEERVNYLLLSFLDSLLDYKLHESRKTSLSIMPGADYSGPEYSHTQKYVKWIETSIKKKFFLSLWKMATILMAFQQDIYLHVIIGTSILTQMEIVYIGTLNYLSTREST